MSSPRVLCRVVITSVAIAAAACASPPATSTTPKQCYRQKPFRNTTVLTSYRMSFLYTPKDGTGATGKLTEVFQEELNAAGTDDAVKFVVADGVQANVHITAEISNDGDDHLTAVAQVEGLGKPYVLFKATSGDAAFVSPEKMLRSLAREVYRGFHFGWSCLDGSGEPLGHKPTASDVRGTWRAIDNKKSHLELAIVADRLVAIWFFDKDPEAMVDIDMPDDGVTRMKLFDAQLSGATFRGVMTGGRHKGEPVSGEIEKDAIRFTIGSTGTSVVYRE